MSQKSSFVSFFSKYLSNVYVDENLNPIKKYFQMDVVNHGEFGVALGSAGIKVHAKSWLKFFKVISVDVEMHTNASGIVTCEYRETALQRTTFKTINPVKNKIIIIRNSVALGYQDNKITHYAVEKDIPHLMLQLVSSSSEKYDEVMRKPIFSKPYHVHIAVITEYLKSNNILITSLQSEYLCGYFMGAVDDESRNKIGLRSMGYEPYNHDIQKMFDSKDDAQIRRTLRESPLAVLLIEGYNLLRSSSDYNLPMYLTDGSKYLL